MPDYAVMYQKLFCSITKAITILQEAQQETEEIYISSNEPIIKLFSSNASNENRDGDHN